MKIVFGQLFFLVFSRKKRQPFTEISLSKKRRYLTEKPKKIFASADTSTDKLEEGQDTEQEFIHVTMK